MSHGLFRGPSNKVYLRAVTFVSMVQCSLRDTEWQEAAACPSPLCPPHAAVAPGPEHVTVGPDELNVLLSAPSSRPSSSQQKWLPLCVCALALVCCSVPVSLWSSASSSSSPVVVWFSLVLTAPPGLVSSARLQSRTSLLVGHAYRWKYGTRLFSRQF